MRTPYNNRSGNSPIVGYEIAPDAISVWFDDSPEPYVYSARRCGRAHIAAMHKLAEQGKGLAAYITRNVRQLYEPRKRT